MNNGMNWARATWTKLSSLPPLPFHGPPELEGVWGYPSELAFFPSLDKIWGCPVSAVASPGMEIQLGDICNHEKDVS